MHAKDFYDHISTSHSQDELHHSGSPLVCQQGLVCPERRAKQLVRMAPDV